MATRKQVEALVPQQGDQGLKIPASSTSFLHNKNKVRIFDLIVRIIALKDADIGHSSKLAFEFFPNLQQFEFVKQNEQPGVVFSYPIQSVYASDSDFGSPTWIVEQQSIRVDCSGSDEYQFEFVSEAMDKLEANHKAEQEKVCKKDAVLRALTSEQREAIGMGHWRDSNPDGAAKSLASRVVKSRVRTQPVVGKRTDDDAAWVRVKRVPSSK